MQLAATASWENLKRHVKSLFPFLNKVCIEETVATVTFFADTKDVSGATYAQVFYGLVSHYINAYGMKSETEGPNALDDFAHEEGIPPAETMGGCRSTERLGFNVFVNG